MTNLSEIRQCCKIQFNFSIAYIKKGENMSIVLKKYITALDYADNILFVS